MFPYKRVIIVGNSGSGKSTLAREMGERFGLPVVHLDKLFWLPNWIERSDADFDKLLAIELNKPHWIMDGNYCRTVEFRLAFADAAIMLDLPPQLCLNNAEKRAQMYSGKTRPDITDGCVERMDDDFRDWILNYNNTQRDNTLRRIEQSGKPFLIFDSWDSVTKWLDSFA